MSIIQSQTRQFNQDTFGPIPIQQPAPDTPTFNPLVAQSYLPPNQALNTRNQFEGKWDNDFKIFEAFWQREIPQTVNGQVKQVSQLEKPNKLKKEEGKKVLQKEKNSKNQSKSSHRGPLKKRGIQKRKQDQSKQTQPKISIYFKSNNESIAKNNK